jgi:formylglycine-generating enzyme required for sulfatase activity
MQKTRVVWLVGGLWAGLVALSGSAVAAERAGPRFRDCADCPEMVLIPAGTFVMGSEQPERDQAVRDHLEASSTRDEEPHEVQIRRFAMSAYEVTRDQFARFVIETGHEPDRGCLIHKGLAPVPMDGYSWADPGFPQTGDHPVLCVSWYDAVAYTEWLSRKTGRKYRLPSESEWEYAARAGTRTVRFWGDTMDLACEHANVRDAAYARSAPTPARVGAAQCDDGYAKTAPVGRFKPNAFGLYDVLGNAWEWTADCKHDTYVGAPADGSAWTEPLITCVRRVSRGGGWSSVAGGQRSANRGKPQENTRVNFTGFRLARDAD